MRAEQFAKLVAESYAWLAERVSLPRPNLPEIELTEADPEAAAEVCRRTWNLGDRPILRLGELFESQGIVVVRAALDNERLDAFSCLVSSRPFVFLGSAKQDRARSRFDAAHELGHLLLHQHYTERYLSDSEEHKDIETQANQFASAFLMPATKFRNEVFDASLNGFLRLKERWGVSVQAMVMRSFQLGLIDEHRKTELCRQISAKGWRKPKGEPLDDLIPNVNSIVGRRSIELLIESKQIQLWEIPGELPFPEEVLSAAFSTPIQENDQPIPPNVVLLSSVLEESAEHRKFE